MRPSNFSTVFWSSAALCAAFILTSCATMSADECRVANWLMVGAADGAQGRLPSYVNKYAKDCAKAGIQPNFEQWSKGRQQGLKDYCTPINAYNTGRKGKDFAPVCQSMPQSTQDSLVKHYEKGYHIHTLEHQVSRIRSDIQSLEKKKADIMALKTKCDDYKDEWYKETRSKAWREQGRAACDQMYQKRHTLKQDYDNYSDKIDDLQDDLRDAEKQLHDQLSK